MADCQVACLVIHLIIQMYILLGYFKRFVYFIFKLIILYIILLLMRAEVLTF